MEFNIGTRVVCMNDEGQSVLKKGEIYTVHKLDNVDGRDRIYIEEWKRFSFSADRFSSLNQMYEIGGHYYRLDAILLWNKYVVPAVKEINLTAGLLLEDLTDQYVRFGDNNTRDLRVCRFQPFTTLACSFSWDCVGKVSRDEWVRIARQLDEQDIYSRLRG